jgi:protein TonB
MKKERKEKSFIKKPVYPGGSKAMKAFIKQHLRYPDQAAKNNIEGTVSLKYSINHLGKVVSVRIISGLGYGCDEEAIRVIKMFKFQVDKVRKLRVTYKKDIHVHFRKPKTQKTMKAIKYAYQTKSSPTDKDTSVQPEKKKGYSYTIKY